MKSSDLDTASKLYQSLQDTQKMLAEIAVMGAHNYDGIQVMLPSGVVMLTKRDDPDAVAAIEASLQARRQELVKRLAELGVTVDAPSFAPGHKFES